LAKERLICFLQRNLLHSFLDFNTEVKLERILVRRYENVDWNHVVQGRIKRSDIVKTASKELKTLCI
jgi:hypothetical protein